MKPGSPHASVVQPPPRPRTSPSARSAEAVFSSCSASSISSTSRCGSCGEELDILLLPGDPDPLTLTTPELRIPLTRDLCEQPLAARREVELHQVAEELDEDDLALGRVHARIRDDLADLDDRRADRDLGCIADGRLVTRCP